VVLYRDASKEHPGVGLKGPEVSSEESILEHLDVSESTLLSLAINLAYQRVDLKSALDVRRTSFAHVFSRTAWPQSPLELSYPCRINVPFDLL
jgi:hypothetical protein